MKGEKTLSLAGDKVKLRLDLNAIVDFCDAEDIEQLSEFNETLQNPRKLRSFVKYLAKSGDNEISDEKAGKLTFDQLNAVFEMVSESSGNVQKVVEEG